MAYVFISYVRDDSDIVDRLCAELRVAGVDVWLDRNDIRPGQRWQMAVRQAIQEGAYFLACFSEAYLGRESTYMNEELTIAIEELRKRSVSSTWFVPVLLSDVTIPPRSIGETLRDLQAVHLHSDWRQGVNKILQVTTHGSIDAPDPDIPLNQMPLSLMIPIVSLFLLLSVIVSYMLWNARDTGLFENMAAEYTNTRDPINVTSSQKPDASTSIDSDSDTGSLSLLNPASVLIDNVTIVLNDCVPSDSAIECTLTLQARSTEELARVSITDRSYALTDNGKRMNVLPTGIRSRLVSGRSTEGAVQSRIIQTILFEKAERPRWMSVWLHIAQRSSGTGRLVSLGNKNLTMMPSRSPAG